MPPPFTVVVPMYKKLHDYRFFQQVKADGMTVFWNDEIDLDPDYLYEHGVTLPTGLD
jgi:hypothetical protein